MIADIAEDGILGQTDQEVGERVMFDILQHLAYLKDQSNIERLREQDRVGGRVLR